MGDRMTLHDRLRAMCETALPGTLIPVDSLRAVLNEVTEAPVPIPRLGGGDLTVEEVAERMHRKPSTIRGWLSAGTLRGYKLQGRDWRVSQEALREFVQAQRDAATRMGESRSVRPRGRAGAVDLGAWRKVRGAGGAG